MTEKSTDEGSFLMPKLNKFFASRWAVVLSGALVGVLAPILVRLGNPGNMGVCMACFLRDISGALGFHRAGVVQYIRPEVLGILLGATLSALVFGEFRARAGSAPLIRFTLGMLGMIGALVFLGCPWRAYLRLSGGDWNAIPGILGLIVGVFIGIQFFKTGFSLGRSDKAPLGAAWVMPVLTICLLVLLILAPQFGADSEGNPTGPVFFSESGPGAMHAPVIISLAIGLVIGILAQRSRFCTIAGLRDVMLMRDTHFASGILALIGFAFLTNILLGQFQPGFEGQPVAHTNSLWNFGGMVLAGLSFTLAGACPGRQLILSGEGDGDAAMVVLGMLVGAGVAHNFRMASSPAGPGALGPAAVVVGLIVAIAFGLFMREREKAKSRISEGTIAGAKEAN
jgi:YedE family putative selenium metabolism protein